MNVMTPVHSDETARLAVVDDEPIVLIRLQKGLSKLGCHVDTYQDGTEFLECQTRRPYDVVFLDLKLQGINGLEVLKEAKRSCPETQVIIITGYPSIESVIEAVRLGAFHYVTKPLKLEEIRHLASRALEHKSLLTENRVLKSLLDPHHGMGEIIGISQAMRDVFAMIRKVAPLDCNILIRGESGTGKELVARLIHQQSMRRERPFVAFNCAGFAEELIASELFGYERGAFTGATATKLGILETAHGGTVFMDEIGDMPLTMQSKLLRVLQDRQILRVGSNKPIQLDLRFIAATNKDLRRAVAENRFREDLFFRLNVVEITLPSLQERREDVPILVQHFLKKYSKKFSKNVNAVDTAAHEILLSYSYPGNVRELENIIERAVALAEGNVLTVKELPPDLRQYSVQTYRDWATLKEWEQRYLRKVLESTGYNTAQAAKILDLPRTTLWRKMRKYGLTKPS